MTTNTFDTLAAARDLEAAGVERVQAEAHAAAIRTAVESTRSDLATQADLAALEVRLVKWGVGLAIAAAGITTAAVLGALRLVLGA